MNGGLILVFTMKDTKENNNIELGIDRSKYLKIILLSSLSTFVQLDNVILSLSVELLDVILSKSFVTFVIYIYFNEKDCCLLRFLVACVPDFK